MFGYSVAIVYDATLRGVRTAYKMARRLPRSLLRLGLWGYLNGGEISSREELCCIQSSGGVSKESGKQRMMAMIIEHSGGESCLVAVFGYS